MYVGTETETEIEGTTETEIGTEGETGIARGIETAGMTENASHTLKNQWKRYSVLFLTSNFVFVQGL